MKLYQSTTLALSLLVMGNALLASQTKESQKNVKSAQEKQDDQPNIAQAIKLRPIADIKKDLAEQELIMQKNLMRRAGVPYYQFEVGKYSLKAAFDSLDGIEQNKALIAKEIFSMEAEINSLKDAGVDSAAIDQSAQRL